MMVRCGVAVLALSLFFAGTVTSLEQHFVLGGYGSDAPKLKLFDSTENTVSAVSSDDTTLGADPQTFVLNTKHDVMYVSQDGPSAVSAVPFARTSRWITRQTPTTYPISTYSPVWLSSDANFSFVYSASYGWTADNSSGFQVFRVDQATGLLSQIIDRQFANSPAQSAVENKSHVHCIVPHPEDPLQFYITDLGRDVVEHYEMSYDEGTDTYTEVLVSEIEIESPRTLAFHPTTSATMYVSQESVFSVSTLSVGTGGQLEGIEQTLSTLPSSGYAGVTPATSHVATDRTGKYLYVANRDSYGLNESANNIAVFEVDTDTGLIVEDTLSVSPCGGNIPRHFQVDPSNQYMLVCNQFGAGETGWPGTMGTLAIFEIDHDNGGALSELLVESYAELGYDAVGLSWVDFLPSSTASPTMERTAPPTTSPTMEPTAPNTASSAHRLINVLGAFLVGCSLLFL